MSSLSDQGSLPISSSRLERLDYEGAYPCPVCFHGEIKALVLMEAFSCNFCHHIFTVHLSRQTLHTADSSQSLAWQWLGRRWRPLHHANPDVAILLWSLGTIVAVFPALLVGLAAYVFPPADAQLTSFPVLWTGLTFGLHFIPVCWILAEYHQFPPYIQVKVLLSRLGRFVRR